MTRRSEAASVSVHVLSKQGNLGHVKGSAHKHSPSLRAHTLNTIQPISYQTTILQLHENGFKTTVATSLRSYFTGNGMMDDASYWSFLTHNTLVIN